MRHRSDPGTDRFGALDLAALAAATAGFASFFTVPAAAPALLGAALVLAAAGAAGPLAPLAAAVLPLPIEQRAIVGATAVAAVVALAVSGRRVGSLEYAARTDELTGLYRYEAFAEAARLELQRAARYGGRVSLIVFDLDRFKQLNDRFGHAVGNVVLAECGLVLHETLRTTDIAGRFGGEEIVALVHGDARRAQHRGRARAPRRLVDRRRHRARRGPPDGVGGDRERRRRHRPRHAVRGGGRRAVRGQAARAQPHGARDRRDDARRIGVTGGFILSRVGGHADSRCMPRLSVPLSLALLLVAAPAALAYDMPSQEFMDNPPADSSMTSGSWADLDNGVASRPYVKSLTVVNGSEATTVFSGGVAASSSAQVGDVTTVVSPINLCRRGQAPAQGTCYATPNRVGIVIGYRTAQGVSLDFGKPSVPLRQIVNADTVFDVELGLNTLGRTLRWTWANGDLLDWKVTDLGIDTGTVRIRVKPVLSPEVDWSTTGPNGCTATPIFDCAVLQASGESLGANLVLSLDETLDPALTGAAFATQGALAGFLVPGGAATAPTLDLQMASPHLRADGSPAARRAAGLPAVASAPRPLRRPARRCRDVLHGHAAR